MTNRRQPTGHWVPAARVLCALLLAVGVSRGAEPEARRAASVPGGHGAPVAKRKLLREGTFLVDRQGWLRPVGAGRWAFVFDTTEDGVTDPPMAVMPSLKLAEMRRTVEARPETVTFRVSGTVYVYKGRNYLQPTFFTTLSGEVDSTKPVSVGGSGGSKPGESAQNAKPPSQDIPKGKDMSAAEADETRRSLDDLFGHDAGDQNDPESLLHRVDKATPKQSVPRPQTASANPKTEENASPLVREGQSTPARRGRLLRGSAGELLFVPDNGTSAASPAPTGDSAAVADASAAQPKPRAGMRLLPCLNLQEMERLCKGSSVPVQFKVAGTVAVYEGVNYLLPTMYLVESDREGNLTPAQ